MDWLEKSISRQRDYIESFLREPLSHLAAICVEHWGDRARLDHELKQFLLQKTDHRCRILYAIDQNGLQYSSNISDDTIDDSVIGRDLSDRPYLAGVDTSRTPPFLLSDVYVDKQTREPCITSIHSIRVDDEVRGYIAADFGLKDLPLKDVDEGQLPVWRQIKGDPAIRSTLFQQTRIRSAMDEHVDEVLDVIESLITEQGVFHAKLHFSSSRATLWSYTDPYRYRLHVLDEIIDPKVCLVYGRMNYPEDAAIPASMAPRVLRVFKALREADENIYLRSGSLNIMNGLVGLNFSCDGSHYMPAGDFLQKDLAFWLGNTATCIA
jgi:hypothetical protein